jgi:hypothetical protein
MSKEFSQDQTILLKKQSIRKLNNLLEGYINSPDPHNVKKAALISKWLKQFVSYISFENKFDPTQNISYKRGNIIKVNFGFNIGCELGGPHYAVVLDKDNKHSADTVTVIPLVSFKEGKTIYERDVFLGNELYNTLNSKFVSSLRELTSRTNELKKLQVLSNTLLEALDHMPDSEEKKSKIIEANKLRSELIESDKQAKEEFSRLLDLQNEISMMKEGSIARIEQITSISKMRIWIPQKTSDVLYNISYSENSMKKINEKIKELFVFDE